MAVSVTIDPVRLAEYVRSPSGPSVRHLIRVGDRVRQRAKQLVGVSQESKPHLRDALVTRLVFEGPLFKVLVGSWNVPYARFHHEGTRPHVIRGDPLLVFYWPKAGKVVYFPKVNHPGTAPNRYLTDALREIVPNS